MTKRSPGEGNMYKRKDGRWQASLQIDGIRRTVYGKTKREARDKLRALQRQVETSGMIPTGEKHTMNELLDAWLESASNLKPSTVASYRKLLKYYVQPSLGGLRLNRVTPTALQNLYKTQPPSVAEKVHRVLHRAFAVAVMWGWLAANPCDRVLKPAYKPRPKTLWSQTELDTFLEATDGEWLHPLWVFLIATGCRVGEALALGWEGVNLDNGVVVVSRTLHHIDGESVLDDAKTAASVRLIALPDIAVEALKRQRRQQAAWRDVAGSAWEEWGLVFSGETGKPLFASTVQHALKRLLATAEAPNPGQPVLRLTSKLSDSFE